MANLPSSPFSTTLSTSATTHLNLLSVDKVFVRLTNSCNLGNSHYDTAIISRRSIQSMRKKNKHYKKHDTVAILLKSSSIQKAHVGTYHDGEIVGMKYSQQKPQRVDMANLSVNWERWVFVLRECNRTKSLHLGKQVHTHIIKSGVETNTFMGNNLVNMYAKCSSMEDAHNVFDKMPEPDVVSWTSVIAGYAQCGAVKEAVGLFDMMKRAGIKPDFITFGCVLRACAAGAETLAEGQQVHAATIKFGYELDGSIQEALILMYAQCGRLRDSLKAFNNTTPKDNNNMVSGLWNAMIAGYAKNGYGSEAVNLFTQMHRASIRVNHLTLAHVLGVFAKPEALQQVKQVHVYAIKTGFHSDVFVGTVLVDIYAKCRSIDDSSKVFENISKRDLVSWTVMISGYCQCGYFKDAFCLYEQMHQAGRKPDHVIFVCLLSAIERPETLEQGKQVHAQIIKSGFESDASVGNALVTMYSKCDNIEDACNIFESISERNVVSWTAMIAGYTQNGYGDEALNVMCQMLLAGIKPNDMTIASVLSACANFQVLEWGKQVHAFIIKTGHDLDLFVRNSQITMYADCGSIEDACLVFDEMCQRDVVSWNAIIAGYVQHGQYDNVWKLLFRMQKTGMKADEFTLACLLSTCTCPSDLGKGRHVHSHIITAGLALDVSLANALATMYAQCGSIQDSCLVFHEMPQRDVVSWNAMIAGYAKNGYSKQVLMVFQEMQCAGKKPDAFTFGSVIQACGSLEALEEGKQVHAHIIKTGLDLHVFLGSVLIAMYNKCRSIDNALRVFDKMCKQDVISWTTMIAGYTENGHGEEALKLLCQMLQAGLKANQFTYTNVLRACAGLAAMEHGKQVHACIIKSGFEEDLYVKNALITLYARCGSICSAWEVFDRMIERDAISWTAMIAGYAQHGFASRSLELYEQMQRVGLKADHVTFTAVLSACSHVGLVDEGCHYFNSMNHNHGIEPKMEHYACMVDLLGRAGKLDEAWEFINKMPVQPGALVWRTFLGACRIHGNIDGAKHAAECLLDLETHDSSTYVLMSNIYAAAGRWDDVAKVRKMMKDKGVKKDPGCSWIEVRDKVHAFVVGDRSHPKTEKIYAKLESLIKQIVEVGYVPNTNIVLHDVEEEQKKHSLSQHSEKLAISFGLISTPPGKPICIIKNLRVCGDCHSAMKFISKIVEREIVVRDANRFHHFKNGLCSCGDYW